MITLKTLKSATDQEVFDQVANHLLTQNQKSEEEKTGFLGAPRCLYKHGDLKCAAGCLISDTEYTPAMENWSWVALINKGLVPNCHFLLINALQKVHDDSSVKAWPTGLKSVAREFHLVMKNGCQEDAKE